jgi:hypothetical protein
MHSLSQGETLMTYRKLLVALLLFAFPLAVLAQDQTPIAVMGQPDLTSGAVNHGGAVDASALNYPLGMAIDPQGGLYVADRNNHRVLYFANDGNTQADRVYGQLGNPTAHIANNDGTGNSGTPSADNLASPTAVVLDSSGGLFITDRDNHRVLHYPPSSTIADRVYGQFGSFNTNMTNNDGTVNYGEPSADNIGTYTLGITIDSTDGIYVSDASNHRVLYFANDGNTTADRVYGQFDDLTTNARNNDGTGRRGEPSANSLNFPRGLAVDAQDGLYVADRDNNRILYFAADGNTTADRVYGQFGSFTTNAESNDGSGGVGTPNADNLSHPKYVLVYPTGGIYVADSIHHRVLYFADDGNTTADLVMGQAGSFTSGVINNDGAGSSGAPSGINLNLPQGLALSADGRFYIGDTGNNRIVVFQFVP